MFKLEGHDWESDIRDPFLSRALESRENWDLFARVVNDGLRRSMDSRLISVGMAPLTIYQTASSLWPAWSDVACILEAIDIVRLAR